MKSDKNTNEKLDKIEFTRFKTAVDERLNVMIKTINDAVPDKKSNVVVNTMNIDTTSFVKEINGVKPVNGKILIPILGVDTSKLAAKTELTPITNKLNDQDIQLKVSALQLADMASISVLDYRFSVKTDGSDTTKAFREVLDFAVDNKLRVLVPPATYSVAGLKIPGSLEIHFYIGAKLKLINNSPLDTRVVSISRVSNVNITGLLEIDGSMDTITSGSEHMHGLFLYNVKNVHIENVFSHDCYGDNVSISGGSADVNDYSDTVSFRYIKGTRARRKNLVIEHVDNLNIDVADLDNTLGGHNNEGGNSIDIEPYNMTGSKIFHNRLGKVKTAGTGNDFTAGSSIESAKRYIVDIDFLECWVKDLKANDSNNATNWKTGIFSYAITLNIRNYVAYLDNTTQTLPGGIKTLPTKAIWAQHGALIHIQNMNVYGGCSDAVIGQIELGYDIPTVTIDNVYIESPLSNGFRIGRGNLFIGRAKVVKLKDNFLESDLLSSNNIQVGYLEVENSCTNLFDMHSGTPISTLSIMIDSVKVTDTRPAKLKSFFTTDVKAVANALKIGNIDIPSTTKLLVPKGAFSLKDDFTVKTLNNNQVLIFDDPDGCITAPKGTMGINPGGKAGKTIFIKDTDVANKTGWRAL